MSPRPRPMVAAAINRLLKPTGHRVTRVPAINDPFLDLRDRTDDPIEAVYIASGRRFLLNVSIEACRALSFKAFPCTRQGNHPFIRTLLAYPDTPLESPAASPLVEFYGQYQPKTAVERLGLPPDLCFGPLSKLPADAVPDSWLPHTPQQAAGLLRKWNAKNHREGLQESMQLSGRTSYGPLSPRKQSIEHMRLFRIRDAIQNKGVILDPNERNLSAPVCRNETSYIHFIERGQHRIAALAALSCQRVPLLVKRVIRTSEIQSWPNVEFGLYSADQASFKTERMMSGASF